MAQTPPHPVRRALVIGAGGMLGRAWIRELGRRSIPHQGVDVPAFDLLDPEAPERALAGGGYSHVLNAAAWTDVDGAEADEAAALELNGAAVGRLASACARHGCHLTHISTDYVFRGDATEPYPTDAPHDPVNAYGRTKAAGERALFDAACAWTLVRTSWVYAPWGANFVGTMLRLFESKGSVRVVDDQLGRPTSAGTLARAALDLAQRGKTGVWHVTDAGSCTWHGFALEIARLAGSPCRVDACTSDEFPRPATRPAYSVLGVGATERELGALPDWKDSLAAVLGEIRDQSSAKKGPADQ
ncbi:MAG: NAD(P)-dependent oxidoreductase [Phycisphaeraceae bacterium]|nr:MAG: NAD(P)-dependent oxidoreductase [Phycisphaeraceae bacterium]